MLKTSERKNQELYKWLSILSVIVLILVVLSCICCAICSIVVTLSLNRDTTDTVTILCSDLISIFGIVISIWVGLNIYNVLEREKVKLAHQAATEALEIANQAAENSHQFKELTLFSIMNVLSEQAPFYSFVSYLLYQFNPEINKTLLDHFDKKTLDDFLRIEHLFSSASKLNRSGKRVESRILAEKGIDCCNFYLEKCSAKYLREPSFVKGYLYLRRGDFKFYCGYHYVNEIGINYLNEAVTDYKNALMYIWGSIEKGEKFSKIPPMPLFNEENNAITEEDDDRTLLMLAYLYNVIGESYNVRAQYRNQYGSSPETKRFACVYFNACYCIYQALQERKRPAHHVFAIYLRNYGTALEHADGCYQAPITPDQLYETAIKLDPDDSLAYYTYCSYQLRKYRADAVVGTLHNFPDQRKIETYLRIFVAVHPANKKGYFYQYLFYLLSAYICQSINEKKSYFGLAKESFAIVKELDNSFRCDEKTQDLENKVYSCISSQPT